MPNDSRTSDVLVAGISRRRLLHLAAAVVGAALTPGAGRALWSIDPHAGHPDPRPGITGDNVLKAEQLHDAADMTDVFDGIRAIPHIADGIRCYCGCVNVPGYRSLLSCYEGDGMARYCDICEGSGRLAVRRHAEGQNLDQIRRAIDARYAHGGHAAESMSADTHCAR